MPMTEAQRRANRKWAAGNITQLSCKMRKEKADAFKAATKAAGTNPNAVLVAAADAFMQDHGGWDAWTTPANTETGAGIEDAAGT